LYLENQGMHTQAIVFQAPGRVGMQHIPMPDPEPGMVQVRTLYSFVSAGTEGWVLNNRFTWTHTPFPCVPGYQRVGVITQLGEGVEGWNVGDVVLATTGTWQGSVTSHWGAHTACANTAVSELFALPKDLDPVAAAGAVVAQVGYNAASRVAMEPNEWVVVYGDGVIGQCAAQAAQAHTARVVLVGHRAERLARAAASSADVVVNSREEDVVAAVRARTNDSPIVAVLDTIQTESAQYQYMPLLAHGRGQIVYCGFTPGTHWADMAILQQRELTTHFVSGWNRARMEATLSLLIRGHLHIRALVTHLVPASHGPDMYRMIAEKREPFLGICLDWNTL
jgi:2-desacetyl-2-hydroxyethyl bacteriochlorophyllide A dehydrogenase